ncbi:MAG: hypothetical protein J4F38_15360, partial [Pseudomonadales bacterium]|nr:hypothetical protein [Pseudomonadales bacterium]
QRRGLSWYYEDGMLVVTAAVPAERGALVINALRKVVDARMDEREAYYEPLLAGNRGTVAEAADTDPADAETVAEPTEPEPVANEQTNGSGPAAAAADGQHRNGTVVADPVADVSAEAECATGDVHG